MIEMKDTFMMLLCHPTHAGFSPLIGAIIFPKSVSFSHAPLSGGRWFAQVAGGDDDVAGGLSSLPSGFTSSLSD